MFAFHKFNEHKTVFHLIGRMQQGETIALVSDAGTPAIFDPGFLIVREAITGDVRVECLPGAKALIPALVCSCVSCSIRFRVTDQERKLYHAKNPKSQPKTKLPKNLIITFKSTAYIFLLSL